jgi:uncharacterized membrane protein (DUF485 family)
MESCICYIIRLGVVAARLRPAHHKKQSAGRHPKNQQAVRATSTQFLGRKHVEYFKPECGLRTHPQNPRFTELVSKRQGFATLLSVIVLTIFYGFFMVVAFNPNLIGQRLSEGSYVTVGIAAELFMFIFFWVLTAVYVKRANGEFDAITEEVVRDAKGGEVMLARLNIALLGLLAPALSFAGDAISATEKQPLNLHAIGMFVLFVSMTLGITYWAAGRTKSASDFYTAGGGITGFQNGLAIAGDYMSAATLLGLTALVYTKGVDGYIYMIAFFAGWPIILFLMAERLRNLGKFTFADITSYRLNQSKVRTMAAVSLTVVCFYLVAQMVGAGQLIKLLFGLDYNIALFVVGALMMVRHLRRHGRHHLGADHQGLHAAGRRHAGGGAGHVPVRLQLREDDGSGRLAAAGREAAVPGHPAAGSDHRAVAGPRPDVRYRRPAAHPDALLHGDQRQGSPQVGALRVRFRGLLLQRDPADGLCGHHHRRPEPRVLRGRPDRRQDRRRRQHDRDAPGQGRGRQPAAGLPVGGGLRDHPGGGVRSGAGRCGGHLPRHLRPRDPQGQGHRDRRAARVPLRLRGPGPWRSSSASPSRR